MQTGATQSFLTSGHTWSLEQRLLDPPIRKVLDRRDEHAGFRSEVMPVGAQRHAGTLGHSRRGRSCVAVVDDAVDGGIKQ